MPDPKSIQRLLMRWYRANRRDLPWRRTRDPYAIWLSEVMLQQTRVDTVIPYYERFLKRWPGIDSLAAAKDDDVLAAWSGLGYYQRARSLHSAVREVASRYNGKVPQDYESFRSLKGVGPYTAGAVLSIAYENRLPIVDGNVIRLLTRVFEIHGDPATSSVRERIWNLAESLLPSKNIGDFNQALMELPALLCTPRAPRCGECPLSGLCLAKKKGIQESLPEKKKKAPSHTVELGFVRVVKDEQTLLIRREKSPMKGMWELPQVAPAASLFAQSELGKELREKYGVNVGGVRPLGSASHSIMDQRITAHYFYALAKKRRVKKGQWFSNQDFDLIPLTTLARKGLALKG